MIRQLPPSVRSQIRSGIAITSVTQCVEELLLNAVDANSRCIAVRIDLSCFRIQVVDNGTGITADQLDKIGQRYSTSKCHTVEDLESLGQFGYRGEALASIRDISYILEVKSRARCCAQTYCKIFQQGKSLDTMESKAHRPSPGTTITVHNLFYNLPVRQKSISRTLEMENICHRVEALALMQPTLSITLRNDTTGSVLLQTHKTNSPLVTFSYLFNHSKTQSLVCVSNSVGHFYIKGYIGKESHYQKDLQFIYVNKRLVLKTQLHKLVNRVLKKSLIVQQHQALYIGEKLSPSKQTDKYPVFVLNIQCPLNTYDITFDPKKTMVEFEDWDTLSAGLEEMCKEFLHKENLLTVDCLFSEEKNENDNLSQEVNLNKDTNKLLRSNYEQTVFDKIDDEMFNNIQTRCLKSGLIKRLFQKNHSTENLDSEEHTANKQYKTENISDEEETIVSSDNINFKNISAPSSVSASGFSDSQPGKNNLYASQENVSSINDSLAHQNFSLEIPLESEKIPFQEPETYVMGACSSKCETSFLEEGTDLSQKDSFGSNYINEKLNHGKHKLMLVADNKKEGCHQKYQTVSIQSEETGCSNKNVPPFLKLHDNEKLPPKQEASKKSKNNSFSLPSGKNIPSIFRSYERNLKEIAPVKMSQSTRSILDHFRVPHNKRETAESAVQRTKPDIKTLHCLKKRCFINIDLEKSPVKSVDSEYIFSKDKLIPLSHQPERMIRPHCKSLSVQDSEMLVKLLDQKSSKNSIASKVSNLYKNNGMKCCRPSKCEMLLTTISAEHNEKYKPDEVNQKESSQNHLENQKMKQNLSSLNPKMEVCYDSRETEVEEGFTSLQDGIVKSVSSFELVNPLLNFDSVLNKNNHSEALVSRQNLENPEKLRKKRQFLYSSAFLKDFDKISPQNAKCEASQVKEINKRNLKGFHPDHVECFSGDRHDNYNDFSCSHRTECYHMHGNVCLPSCSKDRTEKDCCYNLSKSSQLSRNKPSFNQSCSDQNKDSEEFFTESLQLAPSFSTNISVEKSILSLDFNSDSESLQNLQDNRESKINLKLDILNNNFDEGTLVSKWKQSNDTSLTTTEKCSLVETQENVTEFENILKKRDQIIPIPVSDINFYKEKMVTEEECVFGNLGVVFNVSDEAVGKNYSTSLIQPTLSSSYEEETCTQYNEEQRPNQKSRDNCEYLNDTSKILNKNPETSSKSFKILVETSEVSRGCSPMSCTTYEILSDTSEKVEEISQISDQTLEITNLTPEALNEISGALSDTQKTMSDIFKVSDDFKSPVYTTVTSNNAHEIIYNTSETRNILNSHLPNSQCSQFNTTSFERTDQSPLVPNMSFLSNEKPTVKVGFTVHKNNPSTSSTLLSTKSLPSQLLEVSSHKNNPQCDDTSVSIRQDSFLRKTDDFTDHFLIKQAQRSPSVNNDPESAVRNLISHGDDLKSNKSSQQFEPECVSETSSQDRIMKIQNSGEYTRSSWINTETEIQPVSQTFSKEVDINENVEKSSEKSNLAMKSSLDSKSLEPLSIPEFSSFSKSERLSHDLASCQAYVGVCIDSYNIQFMKNVNHLKNSEAMLLQDLVVAKKTPLQLDTGTIHDLDLNKGQQSDTNLFNSKFEASEDLKMESTQNCYVKNESYLQNLDVGCDNEDEKESEQDITDENETDLTLKLWRNWENPIFQISETDVLDIWANQLVQRKLHRVTHSCQFTKAMLSQMETIGQVDNKFIACIVKSQDKKSEIPDHLLMIDQHAAHERVRLEQLTADMYQLEHSEESEKLTVKFSQIFPPWTFRLSDKEMRIVSSFLDEFSKIGLQLKIQQENIIEILTAPSCIISREASERRYNRNTVAFELVQALIKEKIELLHDTRGAHSTLPKTIHNLLCSQACHGAIKFNDPLTLVECQNLLKMLLKCKLPFQCAHGRPSLVPLLNLQHLKWILTKPDPPKINLKKLQRQLEEQKKMNS